MMACHFNFLILYVPHFSIQNYNWEKYYNFWNPHTPLLESWPELISTFFYTKIFFFFGATIHHTHFFINNIDKFCSDSNSRVTRWRFSHNCLIIVQPTQYTFKGSKTTSNLDTNYNIDTIDSYSNSESPDSASLSFILLCWASITDYHSPNHLLLKCI